MGKDILDIPEHNQLPKNSITGLHQNVKLLHIKDNIKKMKTQVIDLEKTYLIKELYLEYKTLITQYEEENQPS